MKNAIIFLGAAMLLSAGASASEQGGEDPLAGFERTGEVSSCISARSANVTALDENRLLYRVGVNQYYLNELRGSCNNANRNFTRIESARAFPRACSGDIINIVGQTSGVLEGTCALGDFEKLVKKPKGAAAAQPE